MIRSTISVNCWLLRAPTVDEVRPAACVVCGAAARPAGGCLVVHGQGLRERQWRGPPAPGEPPSERVIQVRCYECQRCKAVLRVLPCEAVPRRHYAGTAIAFALGFYGLCSMSQAEVRREISTATVVGDRAERRWCTLARWIDAVGDRALFPGLPAMPRERSRREVAERAAMAIGAHAPPSLQSVAPQARAFHGASQMR